MYLFSLCILFLSSSILYTMESDFTAKYTVDEYGMHEVSEQAKLKALRAAIENGTIGLPGNVGTIRFWLLEDRIPVTFLSELPLAVAQEVVSNCYADKDTLTHIFARQSAINEHDQGLLEDIEHNKLENDSNRERIQTIQKTVRENNKCALRNFHKLKYVIEHGFISDVNKQGNKGETLLHILAQITKPSGATELMFVLMECYKVGIQRDRACCPNIPADSTFNTMEIAILAKNKKAVQMLHETTNAICSIERHSSGLCLISRIELEAEREAEGMSMGSFYTYVQGLLPRFKELANNRYALAPCCAQGGHKLYYNHEAK